MTLGDSGQIPLDRRVVDQLNVSRETIEQLAAYLALLAKWQPRINLVSSATLADAWRRHILDSAQLAGYLPENGAHILDIGSGAGFPGLVLSIITDNQVTLVESDQRKSVFLQTVIPRIGFDGHCQERADRGDSSTGCRHSDSAGARFSRETAAAAGQTTALC